jgi:hypothetical protein
MEPEANWHLFLSWVRPVQSKLSLLISQKSILIVSFFLRLHFPSTLLPGIFPQNKNSVCAFSFPHIRNIADPPHSPRYANPNDISRCVSIIKLVVMPTASSWFYMFPLRPEHRPQCPIPEHPQPALFLESESPSFALIQKTGKIIDLYSLILCH